MTADTVGGVWTYCMDLCRQVEKHNTEVHLVTMGARMSDWQKDEAQALSNIMLYETDYLLEWMHNPWRDIKDCGEWLLKLEESVKPDIVHLNCFAYGCLPFKSPVVLVAHSDVYSWYLTVKKDDPPADWKEYFWCVKKGLTNADLVISPSQSVEDLITKIYSARNNTRVIYNGRSTDLFAPGKKQSMVFSMGRLWDEAKNVKMLADAAPDIKAPVRIAGDTSFEESTFYVRRNLQCLGKLSTQKVAEQLAAASIYVLPAKYEPFGLSALEAALSGCALVLGDIPSLREIWGDAALYVDTDDKNELTDVINELLNDHEKLEQYQSKAQVRAKLFTANSMGEEYMDVYSRMMQSSSIYEKQTAA